MPERTLATLALSATALDLFDYCPRLFQFRYLEPCLLPASPPIESEEATRLGKQFHRLVEHTTKGGPPDALLERLDPQVLQWWEHFVESTLDRPSGQTYTELTVRFEVEGQPFLVRLDRLLVTSRGTYEIWDWKTSSVQADPTRLERTWQSRLYPLALCLSGQTLNGGVPIAPKRIRLTYWFAQYPENPIVIRYSQELFDRGLTALKKILTQIQKNDPTRYPKTENLTRCTSCLFRHRCWGLKTENIALGQLELLDLFSFSPMVAAPENVLDEP